jgi:histone deacetylase complex regulatory component SIN3
MELDLSDCQVDIKSMTVISQSCQLLNINTLTLANSGLDDFCMQVLRNACSGLGDWKSSTFPEETL